MILLNYIKVLRKIFIKCESIILYPIVQRVKSEIN